MFYGKNRRFTDYCAVFFFFIFFLTRQLEPGAILISVADSESAPARECIKKKKKKKDLAGATPLVSELILSRRGCITLPNRR